MKTLVNVVALIGAIAMMINVAIQTSILVPLAVVVISIPAVGLLTRKGDVAFYRNTASTLRTAIVLLGIILTAGLFTVVGSNHEPIISFLTPIELIPTAVCMAYLMLLTKKASNDAESCEPAKNLQQI